MRRHAFLRFQVALILASSLLIVAAGAAFPGPRIEFQELTYDWGEALEGELVTHAFQFKNAGNQLLRIHNVRSS